MHGMERRKMKKLYLSETDKKIGGVCGGLGEYFERDPTIVRILFALLILFSFGFGLLAYLALWLIIPKRPSAGAS
jgi:phage shock protein PspC (stress-responsive transcriptional regulator)